MNRLYELVDRIGRFTTTMVSIFALVLAAAKGWDLDTDALMLVAVTYISGNAIIKASANLGGKKAKR